VFDVMLAKLGGREAYLRMAVETTTSPLLLASGRLTKINHPGVSFCTNRTRRATWAAKFANCCHRPAGRATTKSG
jgi:hypothetical protein